MSKYLTTQEVADHYGVTARTVRNWVAKGQLEPTRRLPSGQYRFDQRLVDNAAIETRIREALDAYDEFQADTFAKTNMTNEEAKVFLSNFGAAIIEDSH